MRKYLILLLISGCSANLMPDENRAKEIVWRENLHDTNDPPEVVWSTENCWYGSRNTAVIDNDKCYAGLYYPGDDKVYVAWRGSFSTSAYTHELIHAYQWLEFGESDPFHKDSIWSNEDRINQDLFNEGL